MIITNQDALRIEAEVKAMGFDIAWNRQFKLAGTHLCAWPGFFAGNPVTAVRIGGAAISIYTGRDHKLGRPLVSVFRGLDGKWITTWLWR